MNTQPLIVPIDPIGLPAPLWLFQALHWLTLLLHFIAMNFMVTAAGVALITRLKLNTAADGGYIGKLYAEAAGLLPILVAATVTLGVAPLLFSQVIYGHFVYPSGIAIGWFWWGVIPLLILAYGGFYMMKFRAEEGRRISIAVPLAALMILIWISFTYSNMFNLSAQPDRVASLLMPVADGWRLNLSDPSTFPRWLHMVVGAVAVGGVGLMWLGWLRRSGDAEQGRRMMTLGQKLYVHPTTANIIIGFLFMMTLKRPVMLKLMGQGLLETFLWFIGMAAALAAIPFFNRAAAAGSRAALIGGSGLLFVTLGAMVWLRERVRIAYLEPYFKPSDWEVKVQTGPIVLFFVSFTLGIALFWWLFRLARTRAD